MSNLRRFYFFVLTSFEIFTLSNCLELEARKATDLCFPNSKSSKHCFQEDYSLLLLFRIYDVLYYIFSWRSNFHILSNGYVPSIRMGYKPQKSLIIDLKCNCSTKNVYRFLNCEGVLTFLFSTLDFAFFVLKLE